MSFCFNGNSSLQYKMGRKAKTEDDDDNVEEVSSSGGGKSKGLNWSAIGIMLMFGIPVVLAGVIQVTLSVLVSFV